MRQRARLFFGISLVILDAMMAALAFYGAYRLRLLSEYENIAPFPRYWGVMVIHVVSVLVLLFFYKLYHRSRAFSHVDEFYAIFGAGSVGSLIGIALISFIYKNELDYQRLMMIYAWLLTIVLVTLGRIVYARLRWAVQARGYGRDKVLIVGTSDVGRMILQKIRQSPGLGYEVVGFVTHNGNESTDNVLGVPILGTTEYLSDTIDRYNVKEVIIGLPEVTHQEILSIIARVDRGRVSVKVFPDVFQIMASAVSIGDLNGLPLLTIHDIALRGWRLGLKRAVDLLGSVVSLILFSPLMLLVAILVKLDSPGPVFYVQERMGLDGRLFKMLKFRSMRQDAEKETGPVWARSGDPRRTRLGGILRRISIDETPQLVNVLLGEMSLVGPRPERPVFVEQFKRSIPRYMDRHREKAGMTGWAQINGLRGDTSITERTKYDLWYIENWSLMLDLRILLRTMLLFLGDRSAR
jgi:exopolysaccharide biosynthesis polyprenyl glycosylphosphotransferase